MAACAIVSICVDAGVQTDESCADHVSVHREPWVDGRSSYMSTPVRHFARTAVRMHTGRDGRVRQLCGPGITHILQGRAKQFHVQQWTVPARVQKKQKVAPMPRRVWKKKEAHTAVPSRVDQEGGCGVVGRQDLKTARTCHVHITSPFPEDPHALGTTLLEGGRMIRA